MFYSLRFFHLVLCFCFIYVEAAADKIPDEEDKPLKGQVSRAPKGLSSLSLLSCVDLKEQDEKERTAFYTEVARLRELLTTPGRHVVVFDCHGSLTNQKIPEITEGPYRQIVDLYHEFSALDAIAVISSAWQDMERVLQSLHAAGIKSIEETLTGIVFEERTQTEYTIAHAGNVVSARQEPHLEKNFVNKLEAALWYARQQGITSIASITLLDDQDTHVRCFMKEGGEMFGVHYPAPRGILVPSYAVFNPEQ